MNSQLSENYNSDDMPPQKLFKIFGDELSFTCSDRDRECHMKEGYDILKDAKCHFICNDNQIVMIPFKGNRDQLTDICPAFFQMLYNPSEKMELCYYNFESPNKATENLLLGLDRQISDCASDFCNDSGGIYNNGDCKCGGESCNNTYVYAGHTYKYCTTNGPRKRCVGGVWQSTGTMPTDQDINRWKRDLRICMGDATSTMSTTDSISDLAGRLAKVEDQFGLSKWRTADGKFNTARLASDLTAGVVLGTTGALVTSSVVKKKQVKDGFESLECMVGGQHVGDWGDVFHIDGK